MWQGVVNVFFQAYLTKNTRQRSIPENPAFSVRILVSKPAIRYAPNFVGFGRDFNINLRIANQAWRFFGFRPHLSASAAVCLMSSNHSGVMYLIFFRRFGHRQ
ncbi:hypothetical protein DVG78_26140 [Runella aurantiaca]|uniref:Uncharacterized protein n=1 Tax=Runella aurantiaca TaxID=2282308 RepID=A0A369I251_9BACT|nr:hypothetical protein DVG78_26140 [Runella aurantiaca]